MKIELKTLIAVFPFLLIIACNGNGDGTTISGSGTVEIEKTSISAQVPGKLLKVLKDEGSKISAGDTVAVIDSELLEIQLAQAEAQYEMSRARYDLLTNGARKEDITAAREQLNQARENFELADADAGRIRKLFESGSATQKQFDDASARLRIAASRHKQAKAAWNKIKNFAREEELKQAEAAVKAAEAGVRLLKKKIYDSFVISPIDGEITDFYYESGEMVPAYSILCGVNNPAQAEVKIYVAETDLGKIRTGMNAKIFSDSYPDEPIIGKVTKISDEAEFTPKTIQTKEERTKLVYEVTISAENPDDILKGGMPVDVEIEL